MERYYLPRKAYGYIKVPNMKKQALQRSGGEIAVGNSPLENCKQFWMESIVERGKR